MNLFKLSYHFFCRVTILPLIKRFMFFGIKGTKKILNRQMFGGYRSIVTSSTTVVQLVGCEQQEAAELTGRLRELVMMLHHTDQIVKNLQKSPLGAFSQITEIYFVNL